jgi:ribosome-associated protein
LTEPAERGRRKGQAPGVTGAGDPDDHEGELALATSPASARLRGLPSRRSGSASRAARTEAVDEEALALAHRVVELASDKKASDIVLLDVRAQTSMADYFVICTGASDRQLGAITDGIVEGAKAIGVAPLGREGDAGSRWLLIDFGSVIVHVMSGPERDFYQLEKLWSDAALLLHVL